jgi:hypothetical protein
LVSVERDAEEDARQIFDAINSKLASFGYGQLTDRNEVEATIYIVVRKEHCGGGVIGKTSKADMMGAVLGFLMEANVITEEFAKAVYEYWVIEPDAKPS